MAGVINTSQTFANGDSVTSTKLNSIATGSTFTSDAVTGTGLTVTGAGTLSLGTVSSSNMGTNSVLAGSIADGVITNVKIGASAAIDLSKLATGALPVSITVASANIVDGTIATADIADANITSAKLSGAQTGSAPIYGARAWVRFNGNNNSSGTPDASNTTRQILASGNVTSVTKSSTGLYVIAFTTSLPSANYVAVGSRSYKAGDSSGVTIQASSPTSQTSSAFTFYTLDRTGGAANSDDVQVVIFG